MKIPEDVRKDFLKLQQLQQQVQVLMFQKQNVQMQLSEVENALKELDGVSNGEIFEIVGTIMLKKSREDLKSSLGDKKEILDLRISTIDKQLNKLGEEAKALQEKVGKHLRGGG